MVDRLTTFSRPSAPQKRFWANGRSAEMHSTTVFSSLEASALNLRTEVAQVGVSMLGKMFSSLRLPAKLARVTSASDRKSTRLNSSHVKISNAVFCLKQQSIAKQLAESMLQAR